jgi:hypothetical protein
VTCTGVLQPQGSGTSASPVVLNAYGSGALPTIDGGGALAAVYLYNVQGWEIRDLDVTDPGPSDGSPRIGIYVLLQNYGTGSHYVIDHVNVNDVTGCECFRSTQQDSGGIIVEAGGSTVPTGFNDIQVSNSTVSGVDGLGIATVSTWDERALDPSGTGTYVPMDHVRIFGNRLSNLGGDGILMENGYDPVAEHNSVDGFGLRATTSHAGILAYNSNNALIQYNVVSGGSGNPISFAFSADPGNSNMLFQYNYSHDNNGPFMLFCAYSGTYTDGVTVRDNISQNDKSVIAGPIAVPVVAAGCGFVPGNPETNVHFYNNVLYEPNAAALIGSDGVTSIDFSNNIFSGASSGSLIFDSSGVYDHNLYQNAGPVPPSDTHAVIGDPGFIAPGTAAGPFGYVLKCGSPALGAGAVIANNGGRDFFGFPVSATHAPNIGAYQGPCA